MCVQGAMRHPNDRRKVLRKFPAPEGQDAINKQYVNQGTAAYKTKHVQPFVAIPWEAPEHQALLSPFTIFQHLCSDVLHNLYLGVGKRAVREYLPRLLLLSNGRRVGDRPPYKYTKTDAWRDATVKLVARYAAVQLCRDAL
jgi:hypothetical protein